MKYRPTLILLIVVILLSRQVNGQENEEVYVQGRKFIEVNIRSMEKFSKRLERTQTSLLKKLKRKEARLAAKLKRNDSAGCARFQSENFSFDSILQLSRHPDSVTLAAKAMKGGQKSIDSLKAIYNFLQSKTGGLTGANPPIDNTGLANYNKELDHLQGKLSYQQYITELTEKHAKSLESITGGKHGITGIQKDLFYAKSKIKEWKKLADEPSKAEEMALEYLQGTKGFDGAMKNALNSGQGNSMARANNAEDLEAMGIQTKKMLNKTLQERFGNQLSSIQGNMGKQVGAWQEKASGLTSQVKETRQSIYAARNSLKPSFNVNPMRGKPFKLRLEKQYSFNTFRANTLSDGSRRPAIISLAGSVAYRHRPKLSTGLGIASDLGLGQSWSAIRFSFEGIGLRSFVNRELLYGIGLYGGYEITFKSNVFKPSSDAASAGIEPTLNQKRIYSEAVLAGLTKSYRINAKWNGQIQVLYDAFWRDKGLRSPLLLRFVNTK